MIKCSVPAHDHFTNPPELTHIWLVQVGLRRSHRPCLHLLFSSCSVQPEQPEQPQRWTPEACRRWPAPTDVVAGLRRAACTQAGAKCLARQHLDTLSPTVFCYIRAVGVGLSCTEVLQREGEMKRTQHQRTVLNDSFAIWLRSWSRVAAYLVIKLHYPPTTVMKSWSVNMEDTGY